MDIEQRLRALEDRAALLQLKAQYCLYADNPDNAREFADLFCADAVLDEGEDFMVLHGREQIYRAHLATWPHTSLNQHLAINPVLSIDGDQATGHWRLLQLLSVPQPDGSTQAFWACGWYDEEYSREEGRWLFHKVAARVHFCCRYEDGWGKEPFAAMLPQETVDAIVRDATVADNQ